MAKKIMLPILFMLFAGLCYGEEPKTIRVQDMSLENLLNLTEASLQDKNYEVASMFEYEISRRYITGDKDVEKNLHQAEKWLVKALSDGPNNKKAIESIEANFDWHCILNTTDRCSIIVNKTSITRDNNVSWFWSQMQSRVLTPEKKVELVIFRTFKAVNCKNRTAGNKTVQVIDSNLTPHEAYNVKDADIEFKPLDPGVTNNRLFEYVCHMPEK